MRFQKIPTLAASVLTLALLQLLPILAIAQPELPQRISRVTLYRNQAMVTRVIQVPPNFEAPSIQIKGITDSLNTSSVFAEADSPLSIRSVQLHIEQPAQKQPPITDEAKAEAERLRLEKERLEHEFQSLLETAKVLDQLVNFSAKSQSLDLNRGVLDAKSLTELTLFSIEQRRELREKQFEIQNKIKDVTKQEIQLNAKRQPRAKSGKRSYTATVLFSGSSEKATTIRLNYQVSNAGWQPEYIIHGKEKSDSIMVQYSANIRQRTGEPWNDVELTLSSANLNLNAARPILSSLRLTTVKQPTAENDFDDVEEDNIEEERYVDDPFGGDSREQVRQASKKISSELRRESRYVGNQQRDIDLNTLAGKLQQIELQASSSSIQTLASDAMDDLANQTYQLPNGVTIASGYKDQSLKILEAELKGKLTHIATPILSSFAFREAEVLNSTKVGLLTGPAAIYLDGRFVGRIDIPATAAGQKLTVGFGADPQVRTRRELIAKSNRINGGNRQVNLAYQLVVSNFKDEPIRLRLIDRVPTAKLSNSISVALTPPKIELSDDPLYQRVAKPSGILRWDLEVDKERFGGAAFDLHYDYTMEFARDLLPSTKHSMEEILADYRETKIKGNGGGFGGGSAGGGGGFGGWNSR